VLLAVFLSACSAEPFPTCCDATGVRDVPYTTTYRFNFRTGSFDVVRPNPERILGILTQADVLTLMNAASVTQSTNKGLISGTLNGPRGPLREASVVVRDADGNLISVKDGPFRNFFYNSLGRVPDFLISAGSSDQGSFTMFNAPPGELFVQVVEGGRGNGRISAYPSSVSIGRYGALEVFPPVIGALGVGVDAFSSLNVPDPTVAFLGWNNGSSGNTVRADANGLFLVPRAQGLPTQAEMMLSLSAPGYRTTYYRIDTPISRVIARQQAFDPVTFDNLLMYPDVGVQALAAAVGETIPPSAGMIIGRVRVPGGTGVSGAEVTAMDRAGVRLVDQGIRLLYADIDWSVVDRQGNPRSATTTNGRFFLFIPDCDAIAGGTVYLNAVAETVFLPPALETGRATAPCIPGGVFVQDIEVQDFPKSASGFYTTSFQGRVVTPDRDAAPVANARIDVLGVRADSFVDANGAVVIPMSDTQGAFIVNRGQEAGAVEPLLSFSPYTARVSVRTTADPDSAVDPGYLPTYVNVVTGLNGGRQDLIVIPSSVRSAACGSDSLSIFGVIRDLGAVDASRAGLPVEGVSVAVANGDGTPAAGRVVYQGSSSGTKTGLSGLFAVCNLPAAPAGAFPPLYQVRVVSEDDSGAIPVEVFSDGVTIVNMVVNKALPKRIPSTGRVTQLLGPEAEDAQPVAASIAVLGDVVRATTGDDGRLTGPVMLDSFGTYIVRAEKSGYLPTLNYHVATPARLRQDNEVLTLPDLVITSRTDLNRVGIPAASGSAIVAGKVVTPGFAPRETQPLVSGLAGTPIRLLAGFFDQNDLYPDILAVFSNEAQFWYGDGVGSVVGPTQVVIRDEDGNALSVADAEPADFDLDGNVDVVVIADQKVYAAFGRNDGSFESAQELAITSAATGAFALAIADLDADGDQDVVAATNGGSPIVRFINKTGSSFTAQDPVGDTCGSGTDNSGRRPVAMGVELVPGAGPNAMVIADEDGSLCLYPFNRNGNPLDKVDLAIPAPAVWMDTAFLDTDAIADTVVVHETGVSVFISVAPPTIPPGPIVVAFPEGFSPRTALLGDLSRDSRADLLVSGDSGVLFYPGAGNGQFNTPTMLSGSAPTGELTAADLGGDGRFDVVAQQSDGNLVQFRGSDVPAVNVRVEARDAGGTPVGQVHYLDAQGAVAQAATATGPGGRFVISNVPPGFTMVRVAAGGSGNALVSAYPDTVSYSEVNVNPVPGTVAVKGQTIDPIVTETSGTVAEGILVTALGTGASVRSTSGNGPADPTTGAFELTVDANSEYVLKLEP
jgi:hypothetical protein